MASLMEDLIDVLTKEHVEYEKLLELSKKKTPIIVKGSVIELQKITDEEQSVVERVSHLEKKRNEVLNDIATVINKDVNSLKIMNLIQLLGKQPVEQKKLSIIYDKLKSTLSDMMIINTNNRELIQQSLEMVEFDMNLIQAMRQAPETADYNKGAYSAGNVMGMNKGSFDAKQ